MKASFGYRLSLAFLVLAMVGTALAVESRLTDDEMAARQHLRRGGSSLDEDYNQLRYVKTTDFGATWTLHQAGDISTFAPTEAVLPDFSAVVMSNGELCYVVTLATAATAGVYSLAGPNFTPVLVMAEGNNTFGYGYSTTPGHTQVSRAPDGSLICTIWGSDAADQNTVWAAKSTNNGTSWGAPWVAATEPALPAYATDMGYFKMPARSHSQYTWCQFQSPGTAGYDQYVLRIPHNPSGVGTVVSLSDYAASNLSYMFGGCKPVAYDAVANFLYVSFRNQASDGISVYSSGDAGMTFQFETNVAFLRVRYPHASVRPATETPIIIGGETVGGLAPGDEQCMYWTYDEFGYGGGSWTALEPTQCTILSDENTAGFNSLYVPQMWWWDEDRAVQSYSGYTNFLSGEIILSSRTTDGGESWVDLGTRAHYVEDEFNAATMQIPELCGGENGLAYVIFSAAAGITDEVAPTVNQMQLLTPATDPDGPYAVRAYYNDNVGIDNSNCESAGPWVNWGDASGVTVAYTCQDSMQVDENGVGWYYFTIPDTALGGISAGDSIFFYCDGYDLAGNYDASDEQIIVAGSEWLGVDDPALLPLTFTLLGNFPNPFNPSTDIMFDLATDNRVDLAIFNTLGQKVRDVYSNEVMGAGTHQVRFNASDLPSGIYVYTLSAGGLTDSRKMVLIK